MQAIGDERNPSSERSAKRSVENRAILQAARKLFLEQGTEVTTAEIARVAGVAKATLYANFSDKEHLIEAVLRRNRISPSATMISPSAIICR